MPDGYGDEYHQSDRLGDTRNDWRQPGPAMSVLGRTVGLVNRAVSAAGNIESAALCAMLSRQLDPDGHARGFTALVHLELGGRLGLQNMSTPEQMR